MAVKASVTITISKYRDTDSITRYYKLQASTAAAPAVPTTLTPSGWSTSEPTYTSGSTNTLYYTDRVIFSDGTFQYTDDGNGKAVKSSSYEAAKQAYNKAQAAQNTATSANNKIDNLQIGGRNYIINSNFYKGKISRTSGCPGWIYGTGSDLSTNVKHDGHDTIHRHRTGTTSISWTEMQYFYYRDLTKVTNQDEVWTLSFYIYVDESDWLDVSTNGIASAIRIYDSSLTMIKVIGLKDLKIELQKAIGKWIRVVETFTIPASCNYSYFYFFNSPSRDYDYYVSDYKLEKGNKATDWTPAPEDVEDQIDNVNNDLTYFKETTFTSYKRDQEKNDRGIKNRLSKTEVTVYGDPENPDDPKALINHIQKVDNDINGSGGLDDRLGAAEGTIEGTGLNEYDQRVKITQRFLDVETDVESIKNIFNITGGTNLIQNSVGYFASNNKPSMWDIASNTIYTPFGYDGDLTGVTVSRGKLFCAKGSITTTTNNIIALLSNKMISISFKYKNGANATSKIKIFNGSIIYFEKTFNTTVNQWTEYKFNPDTDPILANPTFLNTSNSLQISIESTNSTDNNGFEISDLMLNYGNVKPWELSSNEVYGAMVKLSSLGIEVTATTANTKNFMTTDGILVYRYDSKTDKIIGTDPITKITDNGTITNKLESTGDIIERNLIQTMIKDSSNKDIYVEYIR